MCHFFFFKGSKIKLATRRREDRCHQAVSPLAKLRVVYSNRHLSLSISVPIVSYFSIQFDVAFYFESFSQDNQQLLDSKKSLYLVLTLIHIGLLLQGEMISYTRVLHLPFKQRQILCLGPTSRAHLLLEDDVIHMIY